MTADRPKNIALHKPARQSSYSQFSTINDAQGGVDGIKDGGFGFCTNVEENPWWEVDLEGVYAVDAIVMYNWMTGPGRADTLFILVSEDRIAWRELDEWKGGRFGGVDGRPAVVRPKSTLARYVRLQLRAHTNLHLDEVEVYGRLVREVEHDQPLPDSFTF